MFVDGVERCESWQFQCDSGECIDARRKCDGNRDCADGTDERDCSNYYNDSVMIAEQWRDVARGAATGHAPQIID